MTRLGVKTFTALAGRRKRATVVCVPNEETKQITVYYRKKCDCGVCCALLRDVGYKNTAVTGTDCTCSVLGL
jgi:hypothetical protein